MDRLLPNWFGVFIQVGLLSTGAPVFAGEAQDYYAANVETLVQGKCIVLPSDRRPGGQQWRGSVIHQLGCQQSRGI